MGLKILIQISRVSCVLESRPHLQQNSNFSFTVLWNGMQKFLPLHQAIRVAMCLVSARNGKGIFSWEAANIHAFMRSW